MPLQIVQYGDKTLREPGKPVTQFDASLKKLFREMVDAMYRAEGIGLAAQQIGLALQFCVIDVNTDDPDFDYALDGGKPPLDLIMPMALCNPKIEVIDDTLLTYEEGCLSFPRIRGDIDRPDGIRCSFQDLEGAHHVVEANGLFGRCIQHEVDHLNGVLFIDRMKKRALKKIQAQINQLKTRTTQRAAR